MKVLLETERLILRRFTESDLKHLFELDNDPEVMRFINGGTPTSKATIRNDILPGFLQYDVRFPEYGFWAVIEKPTLDFLGWFCLRRSAEAEEEARLGYRFRRDAWGRGYATEGARALINRGFAGIGLQRVIATTYEENRRSLRVMEKLGMKLRRKFRMTAEDIKNADTYHATHFEPWDGDDLEYVLEREDWE